MPSLELEQVVDSYRRTYRLVTRGIEDAADWEDQNKFDALARDRAIIDAAFFILVFAQIERRINDLAVRRLVRESEKKAIRDQKFDKRLNLALPQNKDLRDELSAWYNLRSDPAHGRRYEEYYEMSAIIDRAFEIDRLLTQPAL
jgi:hypothetical protein